MAWIVPLDTKLETVDTLESCDLNIHAPALYSTSAALIDKRLEFREDVVSSDLCIKESKGI